MASRSHRIQYVSLSDEIICRPLLKCSVSIYSAKLMITSVYHINHLQIHREVMFALVQLVWKERSAMRPVALSGYD